MRKYLISSSRVEKRPKDNKSQSFSSSFNTRLMMFAALASLFSFAVHRASIRDSIRPDHQCAQIRLVRCFVAAGYNISDIHPSQHSDT